MISTPCERPTDLRRATPTILCVDDDFDVVCAIDLRLRDFDVQLVAAFDGTEGFGEALRHKPDLILMDLDMPYGDGISMLECFRRNPDTRHTPIVVLTGLSEPGLKRKLLNLGANQYLRKPIAFDVLMDELNHFVSIRRRQLNTAS